MNKILYLYLSFFLLISFPFAKKDSIVLVKDPYTIEDINKLEVSFFSGKKQAVETLIEISKDKNQILSVRMAALEILSNSEDPMLKTALRDIISNAEFVELEIMSKTIKMLVTMGDLESSQALTQALLNQLLDILQIKIQIFMKGF